MNTLKKGEKITIAGFEFDVDQMDILLKMDNQVTRKQDLEIMLVVSRDI